MRHFQVRHIIYDHRTHYVLEGLGWVDDPVSAASADDVLEDAVRETMRDKDLTKENSTVNYNTYNFIRQHRKSADIFYWCGYLEVAVLESIIVDEVIVWDDLDLNELDPKAREIYETSDQGMDEILLECNNIEELNETLLAYGGVDND